jgi:hypothetical protein
MTPDQLLLLEEIETTATEERDLLAAVNKGEVSWDEVGARILEVHARNNEVSAKFFASKPYGFDVEAKNQ